MIDNKILYNSEKSEILELSLGNHNYSSSISLQCSFIDEEGNDVVKYLHIASGEDTTIKIKIPGYLGIANKNADVFPQIPTLNFVSNIVSGSGVNTSSDGKLKGTSCPFYGSRSIYQLYYIAPNT